MIIAMTKNKNGRRQLVLGLESENVRRLVNDEPIQKSMDELVPELTGWDVTILGPEDTVRFVSHYQPNA